MARFRKGAITQVASGQGRRVIYPPKPRPGDRVETSEEMPSADTVGRTLRNLGERGLLGQFAAILMGRAKAWEINRRTTVEEREAAA